NNLKLYTNDGTGNLTDSGIYMLGTTGLWGGFKQITAGDFLGNGHIDIAGIDANNNLKLYTNDGTGNLTDSGIYMLGTTGLWGGFRSVVAGNYLGDGHIGIAGIDANNNLKLYTNDGTGNLTDSGIYMLGTTGLWGGFGS
ncbi:putative aspartyl protease, partial [Streptacidiphilus sp. MAP12-20]|uniref:FG-GAP-like repeat-containing protein n=1 Tax=Streptacidiphilus sp. MAP12-20 TaxID=3156299 RepID=UPI003514C8D4